MTVDDIPSDLDMIIFENEKDLIMNAELALTFWSELFGSIQDKFGTTWELNYDDQTE